MSSNDVIIRTENVMRRFGETVAVNDLSLEVRAGEVFGFLGHNGAGKTTTVRLLNGVLTPHAGAMTVLGLDPLTEGPALRRRTGVLTETPALDEKLTAREQLGLYADLYAVPPGEIAGRIDELLAAFELAERAEEPVGGYSKGMKQRLALARTLIHDPEVIFLDEPTGGLDPVATRQVHRRIERLTRDDEHTVFICTHNLNEAQQLCDRVAVMEHGRMVALGAPHELARQLWKGVRLEIELAAAGAERALDAARALPQVREVTWDAESGLATAWAPEREVIPALVSALVEAGGRIYRLNPQEPTLEDVYFALHDDEQGAAPDIAEKEREVQA
ncbi:MAG: ATP-binding cassette domain-containing protein [Anaerolineales bacterium]